MGDAEDTKTYWRLAERMREAGDFFPEFAMYRTGPFDGAEFEAAVQSSIWLDANLQPNEWFASFTTQITRGQRLGDASLRKLLRARRFKKIHTFERTPRLHVFDRTTESLPAAVRELSWLSANTSGRFVSNRGEPSAIPPPAKLVESFWGFNESLRAADLEPYDALYCRGFVHHASSFRLRGHHYLRLRRGEVTSGSPFRENVMIEIKALKGKKERDVVERTAGSVSTLVHRLGFHGQWEGSAEGRKLSGTFYGPQRPVQTYLARRSPFFDVSDRIETFFAGL